MTEIRPPRHLLDEDYWIGKLQRVESRPLYRPHASAAPAGFDGGGGDGDGGATEVRRTFPAALAARLDGAASGNDVGVFLLLLAGLAVLLSRYTGSDAPLVVSAPFPRDEEASCGLLFFRPRLSDGPTLSRLLAALTRELDEVYRHLDFDLDGLRGRLRAAGLGDERALFDAGLTYDRFNRTTPRLLDLDLWFAVEKEGSGLHLRLRDREGRRSPAFLDQLGRHFENVLGELLARSGRPVGEIDLLTAQERAEIVSGLNPGEAAYPSRQGLAELFAEQTARDPGAPAVVTPERTLTYGELDREADRLARELVARHGVGPDDLVGVLLDRSERLVVALLAILKAGGAYVPIDPDYPEERIALMLDEMGGRLVLAEGEWGESLAGRASVLDPRAVLYAPEAPAEPLPPRAGGRNLAYAIYTSGSTGRPKGVLVEQRSVSRLVRNTNYLEIRPGDRILQTGSMSFDASTLEVWGALLNGAALCLAPREELLDVSRLGRRLAEWRVTCIWLTASLFNRIVEQDLEVFAPLRALLVGGERLSPPHVEKVRRRFPDLLLVNGYGPTENTTFTACHPIREVSAAGIAIGRPISNTRVYVLDDEARPVPVGVVGELCCCGDGLARGYLRKPGRTAASFVPDPFRAGERMYRTGDLALWNEAGGLLYVGRRDAQVKVRGFRIEPGEIDHHLRELPAVRQALTVAREVAGERTLVSYLVSAEPLAPADLRHHLGRALPGFMIPSHFLILDKLPLSPNGKVDFAALPAPDAAGARGDRAAPRTSLEERLVALWEEVLGVTGIGIDDSFFDLGGHSLKAAAIVSRARAELGLDVSLADLFASPTIADMAAAGLASAVDAPIPRAPRDVELPLSFAQQRMWFLDLWEPGRSTYNLPAAVLLEGELDLPALAGALREIERRHEPLRTTFAMEDGRLKQRIGPAGAAALPLVDLGNLPATLGRREAEHLAAREARQPFDLGRGPLLRARLLRLSPGEHALLLTLHHIAADGGSVGVLTRELQALYTSARTGAPSPLSELPIQYADYALWQRGAAASSQAAADLDYWKERLRDLPHLSLPTDRRPPAVRRFQGGLAPVPLPPALAGELAVLGGKSGATLFMTVLAGFAALLARISGQLDLAIGSPVAGRSRPEVEPLIGLFVNTLVLRTDLAGDPAASEVVERVRETVLGALAHQDLPFERLVEELAPERDAGRSPLFQVMLAHQDLSLATLTLPGLRTRPLAVNLGAAKFDLTLYLEEAESTPALILEFDRELFDGVTVERLGARLARLLAGMAEAPERPLSALPLLGEAERHQLLREWNDTGAPSASAPALHRLFEAQAGRTPDARAVAYGDGSLTYAELDRRSGLLARRLQRLGVGREVLVGLCVERALPMAVAVLAILKAGGAYVPLDPAYPEARTAAMLDESGARLLLTEERWSGRFATREGLLCVTLDGEPAQSYPAATLPATLPENLAYIIHTSGSTGRPKGVAIAHRSAVALLDWAREVYGPEDLAGVLAGTSLCFDLSVFELFLPWSKGGTVLLAENALALPEVAARERVTLLNTVPSAAAALLREGGLPDSLLTVNLAGEPLLPSLVEEIHRRALGVRRVFDLYGPSEDTTYSTFARRFPGGPATIGRPIAGTHAFLADPALQTVPIGSPGELCLGGAGLARGYLNRPEETALRFVPGPWAAAPGERLYRTGDLARQRPDGTLELLGRADRQVKMRGFRIELGEVETALARHPGVASAVVAARREGEGELQLVAYWVPASVPTLPSLAARELRAFLRESLPDSMLPAAFVRLAELPLLPNGKVDRAALPAPRRAPAGEGAPSLRPEDPVALLLAGIWAEVLGLPRAGVEGDFFALGGHSLLAAQVVSRVRTALGVDLAVRALFDAPTPAALAATIANIARSAERATLPPLVPQGGEPELSSAQARLWFLDRLEPGGAAYNLPLAARLLGDLDAAALENALAKITQRHETLRATFPALTGRPRLALREAPPPLPRIDLSTLPEPRREEEARRLAAAEARAPFDLARGPLLRGRLLRLSGAEHALLLTFHHIVADGWSLGVLARELGALYGAAPLPPLPIQYPDFAAWQRQALSGERLDALLGYWRRQLGGVTALQLPADHPRLPRRSRRAGLLPARLPRRLADDLASLARGRGLTLFMVLLAGFQALLARYSGQTDVAVGSPVAGRDLPELEGLIGLFVNTLVLRTDLSGDPPAERLLARVREVALGAYGHQELPFERLVEELSPERDTGRSPLFQAMLVLQNTPAPRLDLPGLAVQPMAVATGAAKFDLTLFLEEREGGLAGELELDRDLFEAATGRRLLAHLEILLGGIAAAPETPLSTLPLLSPAESHQLLSEWSDTTAAAPEGASLLDLFALQAARTPEAPAVVSEGGRLTYRELARKAHGLARLLVGHGVGPEVRVGICLEPSPDLVAALLGTLLAGGAYVPLDPAYPRDRLAWMIADARVAVVLTEERLAATLPDLPDLLEQGPRRLLLDREAPAPASEPEPWAGVRVAPESLAYVLYTSGSTGKPKGVMVAHRALAHYLRWCLAAYGLDRGAGAPLHSSIGFDLTVTSLFPPLLAGRAVTVVPARLGIEALGRALRPETGEGFSLVKVTPAHLELLDRQLPGAAKAGRTGVLLLGGEALAAESLAAWRAAAPGTRLINEYGPTEATVGCCVHEVGDGDPATGPVPIGRPIAGARLRLLDRALQPVPVGVPGELYIGGPGLARGYLGQPGPTAERFVPDPWGAWSGGERLYRSGDLARHLPDGRLEYLGRADQQLKVRGFRIEPGEIEAALVEHPGVRSAVVVGRRAGDLALVAYWVAAEPEQTASPPSAGELRRFLRERLPGHMVPASLVRLPALPLTAHGKVDRTALPAPAALRPDLESAYTAPGNPVEALIAEIWQRVLGLERVGIDDNFFDAGGHSLRMVEVQAELETRLGREIDLVLLFEHATIRTLAAHLRAGEAAPSFGHVHERARRQQQAAERRRLALGGRRVGP